MTSFFKKTLSGLFALTGLSLSVFAEPGFNVWGSGKVFKLDPLTDGILLGTGVLLSGGDLLLDNVMELNRGKYDPAEIYNKDNINGFDRPFMKSYNKKLDNCADLTLALSMAAPCVLAATDKEEWLTVGVMYAETLLIANGAKELSKLAINRARPYVYFDSEKPEEDLKDGDWNNSFPSGHSTMAFAGAAFSTYTFAKYFPESNWKYAVAAGSYSLAVTTAGLRMASGNHFATDVCAGAVLGTGIGLLVPWIHTFNQNNDLKIATDGTGVSFIYRPGSAVKKTGL